MSKYICDVRLDASNNKLQLAYPTNSVSASGIPGGVQFGDMNEFEAYVKQHCVSEQQLLNNSNKSMNGIFTFLFYTLLFLLIGTLIYKLFTKNQSSSPVVTGTELPQNFGKFSF